MRTFRLLPLIITISGVLCGAFLNNAIADSIKLVNANNGHSYQRFDDKKTWIDAKLSCEGKKGYLATVTSQQENEWIVANNLQGQTWEGGEWLGGYDEVDEGKFQWVSGEPFIYNNWYSARPDDYSKGQDYIQMYPNGQWEDGGLPAADSMIAYLCEWNPSSVVSIDKAWVTPTIVKQGEFINISAQISGVTSKIAKVEVLLGSTLIATLSSPDNNGVWSASYLVTDGVGYKSNIKIQVKSSSNQIIARWPGFTVK